LGTAGALAVLGLLLLSGVGGTAHAAEAVWPKAEVDVEGTAGSAGHVTFSGHDADGNDLFGPIDVPISKDDTDSGAAAKIRDKLNADTPFKANYHADLDPDDPAKVLITKKRDGHSHPHLQLHKG
jgi:hypothetical protein